MLRVLITGGLGYVGGRIASYLNAQHPDWEVVLTTRDPERRRPEWASAFPIVGLNLRKDIESYQLPRSVDCIVHLAAINEIESSRDPLLAHEVNTQGVFRILQWARVRGVRRFIYFSTFHVYGRVAGPSITEESPTFPWHPYAITHHQAEDWVHYFRSEGAIETLILRLSNCYGAPMDPEVDRWSLAFNDLCRQAVVGEQLVLRSSGRESRDFISANDVARAVEHFLVSDHRSWAPELYNLGSGHSLTIRELASRIAVAGGSRRGAQALPVLAPSAEHEPVVQCIFEVTRLRETGFTWTNDLDGEVERALSLCERWFR